MIWKVSSTKVVVLTIVAMYSAYVKQETCEILTVTQLLEYFSSKQEVDGLNLVLDVNFYNWTFNSRNLVFGCDLN
jgi:hypothetical protein